MDDRLLLFRQYGMMLERILDLNGLEGDRAIAKKILHDTLKRAKRIPTLSKLSTKDLKAYIDEITDFFPYEHQR